MAAFSLDPRVARNITPRRAGDAPARHAIAVTPAGYALRFGLATVIAPGPRAGRRDARPAGGAEVVDVAWTSGEETIITATAQARAMLCPAAEINFLSGPGQGVSLIKLPRGTDRVLGFIASTGDRDLLTVETNRGASQTISTAKYGVTGRGGKGRELLQRGQFSKVVSAPVAVPNLDG